MRSSSFGRKVIENWTLISMNKINSKRLHPLLEYRDKIEQALNQYESANIYSSNTGALDSCSIT